MEGKFSLKKENRRQGSCRRFSLGYTLFKSDLFEMYPAPF